MKNLRVIDKEKIESIIKAGKDARIYAVRKLPINVVIDIAVNEEDKNVLDTILQRLEGAEDTQEIVNSYKKLSKVKDYSIRAFVANRAPINIVIEMAIIEVNEFVLISILERLESEEDTQKIIDAYGKLLKAKDKRIIEFTAKVAPIDAVLEMAVDDEYAWVLELIYDRLDEEKHIEKVMSACYRLSKLEDSSVRKFVAKIAPIDVVCEMAVDEINDDVLESIYERFKAETNPKETISPCGKLYKSRDRQIREFLIRIAPIDVVCKMAVNEYDDYILPKIYQRLEKEKNTEEVINYCNELYKAKSSRIRKFVAKVAPIDVVCKMALIEEHEFVLDLILERLESLKEEELIKVCSKLSKAKSNKIREIAAQKAPINVICEMVDNETYYSVLEIIIQRLQDKTNIKEVINNCNKLYKVNPWHIRQIVAKVAPIDVICKMEATEEVFDVIKIIIERLEQEKGIKEVINYCNKLSKKGDLYTRKFLANRAPISFFTEIQLTEYDSDLIEIILERLKPVKDIKEVRTIYNRICKYSSKSKEYYKDMSDDELIEVVEAEGDSAILKLVDEMSN